MSESPNAFTAPSADVDPDKLVRELRQQISAIRCAMEEHREAMLAAGLTTRRPEPASFAPRDADDR